MDTSKSGPPPEYKANDGEEEWNNGTFYESGNNQQGVNKGYPFPPQQQQQQHVQNQQPMYYQQTPYQQQPGYVYGPQGQVYVSQQVPMEPPPPDWALLSWFTCLCCCWPIGLMAVIKSCDVNSAIRSGDMIRAKDSSESAKKFAYLAFGCGIFFAILWSVLWILFASSIHHSHHF